jgi:hypothetical protein
MIRLKEGIRINPRSIAFVAVMSVYIILTFFDLFNLLSMIGIFVFLSLFSSSLATIIYYALSRSIGIAEKVVNAFYSIVVIMFSLTSIPHLMESSICNLDVIGDLIALTLFIIGLPYIVFALINTGFPMWYRKFNILVGGITLLISLISLAVPVFGYVSLTILLCLMNIMNKVLEGTF